MLLPEADRDIFKSWLLPKLETISDADAEVLADYVIALITAEESEAGVRSNCLDSLSDFLQNNTSDFVDEVLKALKEKSFAPSVQAKLNARTTSTDPVQPSLSSHTAPIPSIVGTSSSDYNQPSSLSADAVPFNPPRGPASTRAAASSAPKFPSPASHRLPDRPTSLPTSQSHQSRKRKLNDRETSQPRENGDAHYNRASGGERPFKQVSRRGGRNAQGAVGQDIHNSRSSFEGNANSVPPFLNLAGLPPPPPGVPPFDPSNPMALLAMAAAFGMAFPGMPPPPFLGAPGQDTDKRTRRERCRDYDTKGFCVNGSMCPYEHGGEIVVPSDEVPEYDPRRSSLGIKKERESNGHQGNKRRQMRSRSKNNRSASRRGRAAISRTGPSYDPTQSTLVIEQIPEEHFSESNVREYFSQFGNIADVQMHEFQRLAIVKFKDHDAARQAYNSPKVIFDNRFVKVYWYHSEPTSRKHDSHGDESILDDEGDIYHEVEEKLDLEAIEKRQAEAQKAFEERRRKEEEAAAKAEDIDRQLRVTTKEVRKLKRELAVKTGDHPNDIKGEDDYYAMWEDALLDDAHDLSTLQAEAQDLFAQQDADAPGGRGRGYSRGSFRGRSYESYRSRGRGYAPTFRGGFRGRGYPGVPINGGRSSVKRLDNRPKRISIAGVEAGSKTDETIRQHLLNIPDCTSVEQHIEQPDTLVVSFKERYMAEMFLDEATNIPEMSKLELSWVTNDVPNPAQAAGIKHEPHDSDDDSSATITEQDKEGPNENAEADQADQAINGAEVDMDVADDVDQWL